MITRRKYRERLLPQWLEDAIAVAGLLLIIGTLFGLAVYGYAMTATVLP